MPASPLAGESPSEGQLGPPPAQPPVPAAAGAEPAAAPAPAGGLDATAVRRSWDAVLEATKERKKTTHALLLNATVAGLDGRTLTLAVTTAALIRQFQMGTNVDVLRESLQAVLGLDVQIACVVAGGPPAGGSAVGGPAREAPGPPAREGFAPGDEAEPEDPDAPRPERQSTGEDAALKLVTDQLGGTVVGTLDS